MDAGTFKYLWEGPNYPKAVSLPAKKYVAELFNYARSITENKIFEGNNGKLFFQVENYYLRILNKTN